MIENLDILKDIIDISLLEKEDDLLFLKNSESNQYNCISYAIGIKHVFTWPAYSGYSYIKPEQWSAFWPLSLPLENTIDNFIKLFELFGFEKIDTKDYKENYQTVILYGSKNDNKITHAALLHKENICSSKMGTYKIAFHEPEDVVNDYGEIICYMNRYKNKNTLLKDVLTVNHLSGNKRNIYEDFKYY